MIPRPTGCPRRTIPALLAIGLLTPWGSLSHGQSLAERIAVTEAGRLRFSYSARPGFCVRGGCGDRATADWEPVRDCEADTVRVALDVSNGRVRRIEVYGGGRWRTAAAGTIDAGAVAPAEATARLLDLAQLLPESVGEKAVFAATLAAGVEVWPELLEIARDRAAPDGTREAATFWLGQAASDAVLGDLGRLVEDDSLELEIREAAVFALSQRPRDEGVPALLRVVRENPHPRLRARALFWLGQTEDARALALFEEILTVR